MDRQSHELIQNVNIFMWPIYEKGLASYVNIFISFYLGTLKDEQFVSQVFM